MTRPAVLLVEPLRYDDVVLAQLAAFADVDAVNCSDDEALRSALAQKPYVAVLARLGLSFSGTTLAQAVERGLRWVVTPTTGLDHIDMHFCQTHGVTVLSLKGETAFLSSIRSTAEHTWALLLGLCRKLPHSHSDVVSGRYRREPFVGVELHGKTLGILGYGRLGKMVAAFGHAFGMRVVATDVDAAAFTNAPAWLERLDIDALMRQSDVLSLHVPLDASTRGLVGAAQLQALPRGAIVVNTARGGVMAEDALLEALTTGHLAGAALDVLDGDGTWHESVPLGHALVAYARTHDNLVLTGHVGGYGLTSIRRTRSFMVEKLAQALAGVPT